MILPRQNIAIIGTGIGGLGAALLLHPHHNITLYEKNAYIGGHSRTVDVKTPEGLIPVDTGFIVFNKRNYPLLTRLFAHLDVPIVPSDMSFGAQIHGGWLEYGTRTVGGLFSQKRNLIRPQFWRMMADILRFNGKAHGYLERNSRLTLEACLKELKMGAWFRDYFLLPMGGAIWSTPIQDMLNFPASTFIRFFYNHGLLTLNDRPQWYTVKGGSREYISRLIAPFRERIRLSCAVKNVHRHAAGVTLYDAQGGQETYDQVVLASHADQALAMIETPTHDEHKILSAFPYHRNRAVLHSDTRFMPQHQGTWASWVYLSERKEEKHSGVSLSYWMNNLQPLGTRHPIIVTLNPTREPDSNMVHDTYTFEHPLFHQEAIDNQEHLSTLQGKDRLWFCGAYQRYGFHEDGLSSAVAVAQRMGIEPQWI